MGIDAQMLVRTRAQVTPEDIKRWRYALAAAFGYDNFWIFTRDKEDMRHCLETVSEYTQDGESIFPDEGETFIEVHIATRYYGEGYERGNLPLLIMVADWLEQTIPYSRIWYGGDSSGVCAKPFDRTERVRLFKHFVAVGHELYNRFFSGDHSSAICPFCEIPAIQTGSGGDWSLWHCLGCGWKRSKRGDVVKEGWHLDEWGNEKGTKAFAAPADPVEQGEGEGVQG